MSLNWVIIKVIIIIMKKIILLVLVGIFAAAPFATYAYGDGVMLSPAVIFGGGGGSGGRRHTTIPVVSTNVGQVLGASTGFQFSRNLSVGMSGDDITELQNRLTSEGVYNGPITGYFGPLTMAGVKAYQAKYGIDQAGRVGPITLAKLNEGGAVLGAQTSTTATEQMKTVFDQIKAQALSLLAKIGNLSQ
jgi:hypothetical protein